MYATLNSLLPPTAMLVIQLSLKTLYQPEGENVEERHTYITPLPKIHRPVCQPFTHQRETPVQVRSCSSTHVPSVRRSARAQL